MKKRIYGIDFLRMVSMFMIVMLHTLGHGGILRSAVPMSAQYELAWFFEIMAFCAVNCYAMISGFVGINSRFRYSNILFLWIQVLFYGILIQLFFFFVFPETRTLENFLTVIFPVTRKEYWYFTSYAGMFFLLPFVNKIFDSLSQKQTKYFLITIVVLFSILPIASTSSDLFYTGDGYSVFWLLLMYLVGGCIKKLDLFSFVKSRFCILVYWVCIFIIWLSKFLLETSFADIPLDSAFLIHYTSPMILLASLALLIGFGSISVSSFYQKIISVFSPLSFGVYLFHDHPLVRKYFMKDHFSYLASLSVPKMALTFFAVVTLIFLTGIFVDTLRNQLFRILHIRERCRFIDKYLKFSNEKQS